MILTICGPSTLCNLYLRMPDGRLIPVMHCKSCKTSTTSYHMMIISTDRSESLRLASSFYVPTILEPPYN